MPVDISAKPVPPGAGLWSKPPLPELQQQHQSQVKAASVANGAVKNAEPAGSQSPLACTPTALHQIHNNNLTFACYASSPVCGSPVPTSASPNLKTAIQKAQIQKFNPDAATPVEAITDSPFVAPNPRRQIFNPASKPTGVPTATQVTYTPNTALTRNPSQELLMAGALTLIGSPQVGSPDPWSPPPDLQAPLDAATRRRLAMHPPISSLPFSPDPSGYETDSVGASPECLSRPCLSHVPPPHLPLTASQGQTAARDLESQVTVSCTKEDNSMNDDNKPSTTVIAMVDSDLTPGLKEGGRTSQLNRGDHDNMARENQTADMVDHIIQPVRCNTIEAVSALVFEQQHREFVKTSSEGRLKLVRGVTVDLANQSLCPGKGDGSPDSSADSTTRPSTPNTARLSNEDAITVTPFQCSLEGSMTDAKKGTDKPGGVHNEQQGGNRNVSFGCVNSSAASNYASASFTSIASACSILQSSGLQPPHHEGGHQASSSQASTRENSAAQQAVNTCKFKDAVQSDVKEMSHSQAQQRGKSLTTMTSMREQRCGMNQEDKYEEENYGNYNHAVDDDPPCPTRDSVCVEMHLSPLRVIETDASLSATSSQIPKHGSGSDSIAAKRTHAAHCERKAERKDCCDPRSSPSGTTYPSSVGHLQFPFDPSSPIKRGVNVIPRLGLFGSNSFEMGPTGSLDENQMRNEQRSVETERSRHGNASYQTPPSALSGSSSQSPLQSLALKKSQPRGMVVRCQLMNQSSEPSVVQPTKPKYHYIECVNPIAVKYSIKKSESRKVECVDVESFATHTVKDSKTHKGHPQGDKTNGNGRGGPQHGRAEGGGMDDVVPSAATMMSFDRYGASTKPVLAHDSSCSSPRSPQPLSKTSTTSQVSSYMHEATPLRFPSRRQAIDEDVGNGERGNRDRGWVSDVASPPLSKPFGASHSYLANLSRSSRNTMSYRSRHFGDEGDKERDIEAGYEGVLRHSLSFSRDCAGGHMRSNHNHTMTPVYTGTGFMQDNRARRPVTFSKFPVFARPSREGTLTSDGGGGMVRKFPESVSSKRLEKHTQNSSPILQTKVSPFRLPKKQNGTVKGDSSVQVVKEIEASSTVSPRRKLGVTTRSILKLQNGGSSPPAVLTGPTAAAWAANNSSRARGPIKRKSVVDSPTTKSPTRAGGHDNQASPKDCPPLERATKRRGRGKSYNLCAHQYSCSWTTRDNDVLRAVSKSGIAGVSTPPRDHQSTASNVAKREAKVCPGVLISQASSKDTAQAHMHVSRAHPPPSKVTPVQNVDNREWGSSTSLLESRQRKKVKM